MWSVSAMAELPDLGGCTDEFEDCRENCSMRFGLSSKTEVKVKLAGCYGKCQEVESTCRDRFIETKRNGLDDDALEKKAKKKKEYQEKVSESARDDGEDKPVVEVPAPAPRKKVVPVAEDEAPKRTSTRVSDAPAPAPVVAKEPEPEPVRKKAEPIPQEKKREPEKKKDKGRALDEWDPEAM